MAASCCPGESFRTIMPRTQALMAFLPSLCHRYPWHWDELGYWDEKYPPWMYDYPRNEAKPQENWHLLRDYVRVVFLIL